MQGLIDKPNLEGFGLRGLLNVIQTGSSRGSLALSFGTPDTESACQVTSREFSLS